MPRKVSGRAEGREGGGAQGAMEMRNRNILPAFILCLCVAASGPVWLAPVYATALEPTKPGSSVSGETPAQASAGLHMPSGTSEGDVAVWMAQDARSNTWGPCSNAWAMTHTNREVVESNIKSVASDGGTLKLGIIGWKASLLAEGAYLVSYTYVRPGTGEQGWYWQVNVKEQSVAPVHGNYRLMQRYNLDLPISSKRKIINVVTKCLRENSVPVPDLTGDVEEDYARLWEAESINSAADDYTANCTSALGVVRVSGESVGSRRGDDGEKQPASNEARELVKKWSWHYGNSDRRFPTFLGDRSLFFCTGDTLYAIDAATGKLKWKVQPDGGIQSNPLEVNGVVMILVNASKLTLVGYDAESGKECWTSATADSVWGEGHPMVAWSTAVCFESREGTLYAVDSRTGRLLWSTQSSSREEGGLFPIAYQGIVVWNNGDLCAADAVTGETRWSIPRGKAPVAAFGAVPGAVWLTRKDSVLLTAVDLTTGKKKWELDVISDPSLWDGQSVLSGTSFLLCENDCLRNIDLTTGKVRWLRRFEAWPMPGSVKADGATVYFLGSEPSLGTLEPRRGFDMAYDLEQKGTPMPPLTLHAVDLATGTILWKRSLTGTPYLPAIHDGLLFVSDGQQRLEVIDSKSGQTRWRTSYAPFLKQDFQFGNGVLYLVMEKEIVALELPGMTATRPGGRVGPSSSTEY